MVVTSKQKREFKNLTKRLDKQHLNTIQLVGLKLLFEARNLQSK